VIRAIEALVFGSAAVGLHLAVLGAFDLPGGGEPAQAGAPAAVAMQAPDAALRALVAEWERPPETTVAPEAAVPLPTAAPDLPATTAAPEMPAAPAAPMAILPEAPPQAAHSEVARPAARPLARPADLAAVRPVTVPAAEPATRPAATAPSAAGSAGVAARPAASGVPAAEAAALTRELAAAVRAAIARAQSYPAQARSRGIAGTAVIQVTIGRDGGLRQVELVRSSGSGLLDAAAVAAARAVGRYPAAPANLPGASFTFEAGLVFDLR
jgi:periplasmic protein TonB